MAKSRNQQKAKSPGVSRKAIGSGELARFSNALELLYAPAPIQEFPERVNAALQALIPAELYIYNEFGPNHFVAIETPNRFTPALTEAFLAHKDEHPLVFQARFGYPDGPLLLSDFTSQREWRETAIYREAYGALDVERQLADLVAIGEIQIAYSMCRDGADYTEADRALVDMIDPHFRHARRNAQLLSRVQEMEARLEAESSGTAVIQFDHSGRIHWASRAGEQLLKRHFPDGSPGRLPEPLRDWVRVESKKFGRANGLPPAPFRLESAVGSLCARLRPCPTPGASEILLEEQVLSGPGALAVFGLTARESEILFWISQGKRNAEIGIILGISPKTVSKHAERVFAKLGVETRSAATAMALERLGSFS